MAEIPLIILEAMSCNRPVITPGYRALNRLFQEDDGLIFMDSDTELQTKPLLS
jgi:glycosyltransferase involved in cell wall biosynthesis